MNLSVVTQNPVSPEVAIDCKTVDSMSRVDISETTNGFAKWFMQAWLIFSKASSTGGTSIVWPLPSVSSFGVNEAFVDATFPPIAPAPEDGSVGDEMLFPVTLTVDKNRTILFHLRFKQI